VFDGDNILGWVGVIVEFAAAGVVVLG
jgi:hypothetical protein